MGKVILGKVDVSAPTFIAFIGALLMCIIGYWYIQTFVMYPAYATPFYLVTGIVNLALGILLFFMLNIMQLDYNLPIPTRTWVYLAIGGGTIVLNLITVHFVTGDVFGTNLYEGGLVVALAGFLLEPPFLDNPNWPASKFILFCGAVITIAGSIIYMIFLPGIFIYIWGIAGVVLSTMLIYAAHGGEVKRLPIPYEWWFILVFGGVTFFLIHGVGGLVILVGFLLFILDY